MRSASICTISFCWSSATTMRIAFDPASIAPSFLRVTARSLTGCPPPRWGSDALPADVDAHGLGCGRAGRTDLVDPLLVCVGLRLPPHARRIERLLDLVALV